MNYPTPQVSHSIRQALGVAAIVGGLAFLAGCASEPESHTVSAPPPPNVVMAQPQQPTQVYVAGNAQQTPNGVIVVTQAPPAAQQEVVLAQTSSDQRWVPGYWTWRNSRYEWMAGHWELPPKASSVWVAPRWERRSDGAYQFYEGYWN